MPSLETAKIEFTGATEELRERARAALSLRPNFSYTLEEVQGALGAMFDRGDFAACRPRAEDTRDGVKLTLELSPNPEVTGFVVSGADRLPAAVVRQALAPLYGQPLNYRAAEAAAERLNDWYDAAGIVGRVIHADADPDDPSRLLFKVAEAVVAGLHLRFVDPKTGEVGRRGVRGSGVGCRTLLGPSPCRQAAGAGFPFFWGGGGEESLNTASSSPSTLSVPQRPPPAPRDSIPLQVREEGRTRPEIILRYLGTTPGQVYNLAQAARDVQAAYSTGLFEDVGIRPVAAEGSTPERPLVRMCLHVLEWWRVFCV